MTTHEELRRRARYGHRCWLYWTNAHGEMECALYNRDGIKRAILAVGTKGRFYWYDQNGNSNIARSFSYMLHLWRCAA